MESAEEPQEPVLVHQEQRNSIWSQRNSTLGLWSEASMVRWSLHHLATGQRGPLGLRYPIRSLRES